MDGGANKDNGVHCGVNKLAMHHAIPATKQLLLTGYVDKMRCGNAPVPVAGATLPPSASAEDNDEEDEVVVMEEKYVFAQ